METKIKCISSIKRFLGKVYIKIDNEGKTFYFDVNDLSVYERNKARIDYLKMFKRIVVELDVEKPNFLKAID